MVGQIVSSICQIHNKTGCTLTWVRFHDYNGKNNLIKYPMEIPSGQWAMFEHSGDPGFPSESVGAVVYRCTNPDGEECDWMMLWSNKYGETTNKVNTEIRAKGGFDNAVWPHIRARSHTNHSEAELEKWKASVNVVPNNACNVFATFQGIIQPN
ncbi:23 kDa jasmonate-induced protein-like [Diospyros lotus]|uniref:23 kDa jasmonate-induced protein-like n=1 Tax=Diospyros lotus TaxID=55363 RepID=UPI002256CADC|nr:23 kDa jasmonate-induced protein-like [Diospyros lotus]